MASPYALARLGACFLVGTALGKVPASERRAQARRTQEEMDNWGEEPEDMMMDPYQNGNGGMYDTYDTYDYYGGNGGMYDTYDTYDTYGGNGGMYDTYDTYDDPYSDDTYDHYTWGDEMPDGYYPTYPGPPAYDEDSCLDSWGRISEQGCFPHHEGDEAYCHREECRVLAHEINMYCSEHQGYYDDKDKMWKSIRKEVNMIVGLCPDGCLWHLIDLTHVCFEGENGCSEDCMHRYKLMHKRWCTAEDVYQHDEKDEHGDVHKEYRSVLDMISDYQRHCKEHAFNCVAVLYPSCHEKDAIRVPNGDGIGFDEERPMPGVSRIVIEGDPKCAASVWTTHEAWPDSGQDVLFPGRNYSTCGEPGHEHKPIDQYISIYVQEEWSDHCHGKWSWFEHKCHLLGHPSTMCEGALLPAKGGECDSSCRVRVETTDSTSCQAFCMSRGLECHAAWHIDDDREEHCQYDHPMDCWDESGWHKQCECGGHSQCMADAVQPNAGIADMCMEFLYDQYKPCMESKFTDRAAELQIPLEEYMPDADSVNPVKHAQNRTCFVEAFSGCDWDGDSRKMYGPFRGDTGIWIGMSFRVGGPGDCVLNIWNDVDGQHFEGFEGDWNCDKISNERPWLEGKQKVYAGLSGNSEDYHATHGTAACYSPLWDQYKCDLLFNDETWCVTVQMTNVSNNCGQCRVALHSSLVNPFRTSCETYCQTMGLQCSEAQFWPGPSDHCWHPEQEHMSCHETFWDHDKKGGQLMCECRNDHRHYGEYGHKPKELYEPCKQVLREQAQCLDHYEGESWCTREMLNYLEHGEQPSAKCTRISQELADKYKAKPCPHDHHM